MRNVLCDCVLAVAMALIISMPESVLAQDYDLDWFTVDGGGITWTAGGDFEMGGTIGQPDANQAPIAGGEYELTGGFWVVPLSGCLADLNSDGSVDAADYWHIHDGLGYCAPQQTYQDHIRADLDHDGCITFVDYQMWLECYRMANGRDFVLPPPMPGVDVFVAVLLGVDTDPAHVAAADTNRDQVVNGLDIQPYISHVLVH